MDFFVMLLVYSIQSVIFGLITNYVAQSKGYDHGFAWGFWLGLIGLLVVGFRPNINSQPVREYKPMYPAAAAASELERKKNQWTCLCGARVSGGLDYCPSCRRTKKEVQENSAFVNKVECPQCGAKNRSSNAVCFACGKLLKEETSSAAVSTAAPVVSASATPVPPASVKAAMPSAAQNECISMIEALAKLHEQGILSDEEFKEKKAQLLSRI